MINFKKILSSIRIPRFIFTSNSKSSPPPTYTATALCHAITKKKSITFALQTRAYKNFTLFYYTCDSTTCKDKMKCIYLSQKEFYLCHLCDTLTLGTPLYELHPISRTCHHCKKKLIRKIPPNYRSQPLGRH